MPKPNNQEKSGFRTFGGVFVPNILTILGVIMYLRLGWVVGNAGLRGALIILLIANGITFLTAISISEVATNMRVKVGGVYYMISRSLGYEAGGSIGIPLYLAQAIGIGLYLVGFTEAVRNLFPVFDPLVVRFSALLALTIIAIISTRIVIKIQYFILSIVGLSLISFFLGKVPDAGFLDMNANYAEGENFWSVFAVFFPAVTGILSGVSMSGDLKEPSKSIPRGTIYSVLVGSIIYAGIAIWLSFTATPEELISNKTIIIELSRWAPLLYAGIWGATLSSALANLLAAPRTLQALAKDGIVLKLLGRGKGESNEPVVATIITFLLVALVLYIGDLNTIAPVLTMFFLITYGSVNFIAFIESFLDRPGYRPTFNVHFIFPLLGAISCVWVMFIINIVACIVGFSFVTILFIFLKRRQLQRNYGDVRVGIWSALVQYGLIKLGTSKFHPRNWHPNILIFTEQQRAKEKLLNIAAALTRKSGFISVLNLYEEDADKEKIARDDKDFEEYLQRKKLAVFHKSILVEEFYPAKILASQTHGLGGYHQNTILLEWTQMENGAQKKGKSVKEMFRLIRFYEELDISSLIVHLNSEYFRTGYSRIDVWYDPSQDNGSFMLLLAHLLATSPLIEKPSITIKTVVLGKKTYETRKLLEELIQESRIKADIHVLNPTSSDEKKLEIKYKKIVKAQHRRKRFLKYFGGRNKADSEERENANKEKYHVLGKAEEADEEALENEDEERIKEQISSQVEEKDAFIIKEHIHELILENSSNANLVMLGYNIPRQEDEQKYVGKMDALLKKLPDTILINCPFEVNLFE